MTYREAQAYMEQAAKRGSVLGLGPVTSLLQRLGNPQNRLKVIHVAGTNGKGTTCTFLEHLYRAEGLRVGRYISPTLFCYLERFQINGRYMEEQEFAALFSVVMTELSDMEKAGEPLPTAFEIETTIAFLYFLEQKVDLVVLETGMGGRLDATNVVERPICTVFTSIGMDHMQFLGDTIEQIAFEKAGIIKKGCPAVSYPNPPQVMAVLEEQFSLHNAEYPPEQEGLHNAKKLSGQESIHNSRYLAEHDSLHNIKQTVPYGFYKVEEKDIEIISETLEGSTFRYKGEEYGISMAGRYQIYNAVTAIETKLLLDGSLVKQGLLEARIAGRFEKISDAPLIIRDGAHNPDGAHALRKSVQKHFTNGKIIFIIGVLRDKEYDKMMEILCPLADKVYTITPKNERGLSGAKLRESVLPYCGDAEVCEDPLQALERARRDWRRLEEQGEKAVIIAWGSLSYIGELDGGREYGTG